MSRIPNEGLKLSFLSAGALAPTGLNEQNPERGIETTYAQAIANAHASLNEQNPERGIETNIFLITHGSLKSGLVSRIDVNSRYERETNCDK